MEIASKYNPKELEDKWYSEWTKNNLFHSVPDGREPYCIVIPPPNVTGVLHMGHMLNNTIQDVLVRKARMEGKNACWVPGTDHASIATEAKVVAKLRSEGIDKNSLSREEFLEHTWEWTRKHGGIIFEQLKKLGASCDWERSCFTMDEIRYESVIDVFIDLYNKGLIYRGVRMVNWDPKALTALSDEEVIHKEIQSKLYYLRYKVVGSNDEWVTIATTRPETILGDTAVCVNPNDDRFRGLHGKKVIVPLIGREIPVIVDEYVDMEFGTGCLKITPAHDINDYNLGIKFNLPSIDIFNDNGTLNEKAGMFIGEDRFEVRKKILVDLDREGNLVKVEDYVNKVGYSERTDVVIEPKLSMQWFMKMDGMAKPALDVVMEDIVKFYPERIKNIYRHWMENIKDWCISRQLWWGHRIPAYYLPNGKVVVAKNIDIALEMALIQYPELKGLSAADLHQEDDVMDTWFSSWIWPIAVFDGIRNPDNEDIRYYYPTNDLVTAPEILFFWVARMIMSGLEYRNEVPFKNVYFTGIVRDKLGRKMSKSLGNSPDPISLIEHYGADGVRVGMLLTSPAGNDLPFDESLCEQGRNFSNKIWNALRLVKGWDVNMDIEQPAYAKAGIEWFEAKFNESLETIEDHFTKFRLSDALMSIYKLIWDDFCSWYLEIVKPYYQKPCDVATYTSTVEFFDRLMRVLHPFMPFLTEEIWHVLEDRDECEFLMVSEMPRSTCYDRSIISHFEYKIEVIQAIRGVRNDKGIPNKEQLELFVKSNNELGLSALDAVVIKLANLSRLEYVESTVAGALSLLVRSAELYIPITSNIDIAAEIKKLEEELKYTEGFLRSVSGKLSNEKFISGAPKSVVDAELKKKADAESKIEIIKNQIKQLS